MASKENTATNGSPPSGRRTLQSLRRKAGYASARAFAERLGIPAPTYAKYERQPETPDNRIPMGAAWKIADALGCSIDVVVGRYAKDDEGTRIQRMYDTLTPGSKRRVDEFMDYIEYREHMIASQGRWQ